MQVSKQFMRPLSWAIAVLTALPAAAEPRYDFTFLGVPSGLASGVVAMNDNGLVLFGTLTPEGTNSYSYRYYQYQEDEIHEIDTGGVRSLSLYGINNRGEIVGDANFDPSKPDTYEVVIYRNGSWIRTGLLDRSTLSINESGVIAGNLLIGNAYEGAIYRNGVLTKIVGASVRAINDRGDVTGGTFVSGAGFQPFLYRNGAVQALGNLGGGEGAGRAINNSGEVVGYSYTASQVRHAFWHANGVMRDLGSLGGTSDAVDINDSSQIVGESIAPSGFRHAVLWNDGQIYDLHGMLPEDWTESFARNINRYGQIAATGAHGDVPAEGFVLTLHPDWQGGNGAWDDASHWNYAGFGSFGISPGRPHDVMINPGSNATIVGSADASVRSLTVSGNAGRTVTFDLAGGYTAAERDTRLQNAVLAGSGTLEGGLQIDTSSRVQVGGGEQMKLLGGQIDNAGSIRLVGANGNLAYLQTDRLLLNQGKVQLQNADADFAGGLENRGQMQIGFGSNSVSGAVTNTSDGKIVLSGDGETAFWNDVTLQAGSELRIASDADAVFFGQVVVRDGALLTGTGTSYYEGGLSIGNSPALIANSGSASFGSENLYLAEIGGLEAGGQFDQLQVAGNLNFGGVLQLMWWDDFNAQVGDVFDLFDWGSSSGTFSRIDTRFAALADGLRWDFSRLYTTGEVGVAAVPLPGAFWLFGSALFVLINRRRIS